MFFVRALQKKFAPEIVEMPAMSEIVISISFEFAFRTLPFSKKFDSLSDIFVHRLCEKFSMANRAVKSNFLEHLREPELFMGLVGAVGTDLALVAKILSEELKKAGYAAEELRLSQLIGVCHKHRHLKKLAGGPENERIDAHMDAGDDLRKTMTRGDAVALLGVAGIRQYRKSKTDHQDRALPKQAFILNSLKHPDEIETLKKYMVERSMSCLCIHHDLIESRFCQKL